MRWASLSFRECFWALSMGGCFRDSMDGQFVRYRMDARMLVLDLIVHYAGCDRDFARVRVVASLSNLFAWAGSSYAGVLHAGYCSARRASGMQCPKRESVGLLAPTLLR